MEDDSEVKDPRQDAGALLSDISTDNTVCDTSVQQEVDNSSVVSGATDLPSHIVGVGASAGGLHALQTLFSGISPQSGAAFVVVQHLSPNFNTLMDELLAKHSRMPVKLADDGELLRRDTIYVMRPNRNILVVDGRIRLQEIDRSDQPNLPIDRFFRSLAKDVQNRSVSIILSGTGSDGSVGIKAVREVGGLVMVQQPEQAEFDGMPMSAIQTGYVDVVAELEGLSDQLVSYLIHPLTASKNLLFREHLAENQDALDLLFSKLRSATSIDFSLYKLSTIARRIEHRMGINNIKSFPKYIELLERKPEEFASLKSELLIGVTQFFRDGGAYHDLASKVIPGLLKKKDPDSPVRVWMIGVSSGEEAYSLAMLFSEIKEQMNSSTPIKIFASDADANAVDYASVGVYPPSIVSDVNEERLARFFTKDESGGYVVSKKLRNMIVFANHNVLEDPPFSSMDLVVCRNMLIYFRSEAQERTMNLFNFALIEGGYLWLGSSESIGSQGQHFREISGSSKIWRKVRSSKIPVGHINQNYMQRSLKKSVGRSSLTGRKFIHRETALDKISAYQTVRDSLLEEFCPNAIIVNSDSQALHIIGDCSDVLVSPGAGHVSTHIDGLISPDLRVAVATCLGKVGETEHGVYRLTDVKIDRNNNATVEITARQIPPSAKNSETYYALIFHFNKSGSQSVTPIRTEAFQADSHTLDRMRELDLLLLDSRQELSNAYAELDTTSEELQAANEELMAANEELQSTNEELQSVNEELYTVNTEYQEKIAELMESNADLDNLLKSTGYGIIFLDSTLSIRKFTPMMARFVNLLPGDIDRHISDFKFNIDYPQMVNDLNAVLSSGETKRQSCIFGNSGAEIEVSIDPYISSDNTINGVVMTIRE